VHDRQVLDQRVAAAGLELLRQVAGPEHLGLDLDRVVEDVRAGQPRLVAAAERGRRHRVVDVAHALALEDIGHMAAGSAGRDPSRSSRADR
jgi:hypothetical protein